MDDSKQWTLDVNVHRRILEFLNAARRPEDLMRPPPNEVLLVDDRVMQLDEELHHDEIHDSHGHPGPNPKRKTEALCDRELAKRVLRARDDHSPLYGFQQINQLQKVVGFDRSILERLIRLFSPRYRGKWELMYADAD
jgi:hypothetical protein